MGTSPTNQDDLRQLLGIQLVPQKSTPNQDDLRKILGIAKTTPPPTKQIPEFVQKVLERKTPEPTEEEKPTMGQWAIQAIIEPILKGEQAGVRTSQKLRAGYLKTMGVIPSVTKLENKVFVAKDRAWLNDMASKGKMPNESDIISKLGEDRGGKLVSEIRRLSPNLLKPEATRRAGGEMGTQYATGFFGTIGEEIMNAIEQLTGPEQVFQPSQLAINLAGIGIGAKVSTAVMDKAIKSGLRDAVKNRVMNYGQARQAFNAYKYYAQNTPAETIQAILRGDIPAPKVPGQALEKSAQQAGIGLARKPKPPEVIRQPRTEIGYTAEAGQIAPKQPTVTPKPVRGAIPSTTTEPITQLRGVERIEPMAKPAPTVRAKMTPAEQRLLEEREFEELFPDLTAETFTGRNIDVGTLTTDMSDMLGYGGEINDTVMQAVSAVQQRAKELDYTFSETVETMMQDGSLLKFRKGFIPQGLAPEKPVQPPPEQKALEIPKPAEVIPEQAAPSAEVPTPEPTPTIEPKAETTIPEAPKVSPEEKIATETSKKKRTKKIQIEHQEIKDNDLDGYMRGLYKNPNQEVLKSIEENILPKLTDTQLKKVMPLIKSVSDMVNYTPGPKAKFWYSFYKLQEMLESKIALMTHPEIVEKGDIIPSEVTITQIVNKLDTLHKEGVSKKLISDYELSGTDILGEYPELYKKLKGDIPLPEHLRPREQETLDLTGKVKPETPKISIDEGSGEVVIPTPPDTTPEGTGLYQDAVEFANTQKNITIARLQHELGIEKDEAKALISRMQSDGIVNTESTRKGWQVFEGKADAVIDKSAEEMTLPEDLIQQWIGRGYSREDAIAKIKSEGGFLRIPGNKKMDLVEDPDPKFVDDMNAYRKKRKIEHKATKETQPLIQTLHDLYQEVIDAQHPLGRITVLARTEGKVPQGLDPGKLARRYLGVEGIANAKLKWRTTVLRDMGNLKTTGQGLRRVLKPVKNQLDDFSDFMLAQTDLEDAIMGYSAHTMPVEAQGYINGMKGRYGANYAKFYEAAQDVREWYVEAVLEPERQLGIISNDLFDYLLEKRQYYAPMNRVGTELEKGNMPTRSNIFQPKGKPQPTFERLGSDKPVIPALEQIIRNLYKETNRIERARVANALINLKDISPSVAKIITPAEAQGRNTVFRFENGVKKYYNVPDDLYMAMTSMDSVSAQIFPEIASLPAKVLRAGAVNQPDFFIRNLWRDPFSAFVLAKHGISPPDFIKGFADSIGMTNKFYEWQSIGADHSMLTSLDRVTAQETMKRVAEGGLKITPNPLRALQEISNWTEKPTRIGTYRTAQRKGATDIEAMYESRDYIDFSVKGGSELVNNFNLMIPFFRAGMRGTDKFIRSMKSRPLQTSLKAFAAITAPTIGLHIYNQRVDKEWYDNLPQWEKYAFFMVKSPVKGLPDIRLMKPFELGAVFSVPVEAFMTYLDKTEPDWWKSVIGDQSKTIPVNKKEEALKVGGTAIKAIGEQSLPGYMPQVIGPTLETAIDYDLFRMRPITPQTLKDLPTEEQYQPYTSETAKSIGTYIRWSKLSPIKIDHLIQGYFGGLGRYTIRGIDLAIKAERAIVGKKMPAKPTKKAADYPLVSSFTVREPIGNIAQSVTDIYKELGKATTAYKGLKDKIAKYGGTSPEVMKFSKENPLGTFYKALLNTTKDFSNVRKAELAIYNDLNMDSKAKRELLDTMDRAMSKQAEIMLQVIKIGTAGGKQESTAQPAGRKPVGRRVGGEYWENQ